jgi:hypothetical protein
LISSGLKPELLWSGFQNYQQRVSTRITADIFEPINSSPPRVISLFIPKLSKSPSLSMSLSLSTPLVTTVAINASLLLRHRRCLRRPPPSPLPSFYRRHSEVRFAQNLLLIDSNR